MPDEDGLLDLYFTTEGTGGGAYALGPYEDEDPTDGRMASHAFVAFDPSIPDSRLPSYMAHELQHVLQYASDFTEPSYPVWEGVATAAERWTLPGAPQSRWGFATSRTSPSSACSRVERTPSTRSASMSTAPPCGYTTSTPTFRPPKGRLPGGCVLEQEGWVNEPDVLDALGMTGDLPQYLGRRPQRGPASERRTTPPGLPTGLGRPTEPHARDRGRQPAVRVFSGDVWPTGMVFVSLDAGVPGQSYEFSVSEGDPEDWVLVAAAADAEAVGTGGPVRWTATDAGPSPSPRSTSAQQLGRRRGPQDRCGDPAPRPRWWRHGRRGARRPRCGCSSGGAGGVSPASPWSRSLACRRVGAHAEPRAPSGELFLGAQASTNSASAAAAARSRASRVSASTSAPAYPPGHRGLPPSPPQP